MNRFFIIALLALLGLAAQAVSAGTTYSQAGGVIYKSGDGIGTKVIGTTQGGVDQRLARHAAASSDAAATADDAAAPPDRTHGRRIGDSPYRSDGLTCQAVGGSTYCQ